MKIILYTVCYGEDAIQKAHITNPVKQEYCKKHGYEYKYLDFKDMPERHPYWMKMKHGKNFITKCDLMMWIDADAAPVDFSQKIENFIPADKSFSACKDVVSWNKKDWYMNAGVFIVRNDDFGRELLEEWYKGDEDSEINKLHDQHYLNKLYDRNWNNMKSHTKIWEKATMQSVTDKAFKKGCFIKHCAATKAKDFEKKFWNGLNKSELLNITFHPKY